MNINIRKELSFLFYIKNIALFIILICISVHIEAQKLIIDNHGHSGLVHDVIFIKGGKQLISASEDKTVRIWDVSDGSLIKTLRFQIGDGVDGKIYAAALDPTERYLFLGGFFDKAGGDPKNIGSIRVVDLQLGKISHTLKGHNNIINDLAISADGKWLATASADQTLGLWDISTIASSSSITARGFLKGHSGIIQSVDINQNGSRIVSGGTDGIVKAWNTADLSNITFIDGKVHLDKIRKVLFTPDGSKIISGSEDGDIVVWTNAGRFLSKLDNIPSAVNSLAVSKDNKYLVVFSRKGVVYNLDTETVITDFNYHDNAVSAAVFAPFKKFDEEEGLYLASAGGNDKNIFIWDALSGKPVRNLVGNGRGVFAVGFNTDENTTAFGQSNPTELLDDAPLEKTFNLTNLSLDPEKPNTKSFIRNKNKFLGHAIEKQSEQRINFGNNGVSVDELKDGIIRSYSFVNDYNEVVIGSTYSLKRFKPNGEFLNSYEGHLGETWAISEIEKQDRLLSSNSDQTIKIWNLSSGENLATLFITSKNEWVIWTPQGYYEASAGGEKYIGWHINKGAGSLAEYHDVSAFSKKFHRRDVVLKMLETGSFDKTATALNIQKQDVNKILPPKIKWTSPVNNYTTTTLSNYNLEVSISSAIDITQVKLFVNGRPLAIGDKLTSTGNTTNKTVSYSLKLSSEDMIGRRGFDVVPDEEEVVESSKEFQIRFFAANSIANGFSEDRTIIYKPDAKKPSVNTNQGNSEKREITKLETEDKEEIPLSNLYLVSIGISEFKNPQYNLNYADDDARAVSKIFKAQEGKMFNSVKTIDILNSYATREKILSTFHKLEEYTTPKDFVIIFIASHGLNKDNNFYILPHDGDSSNPRISCVDWRDFSDLIGNMPAKVLLLIDACHSGQLGANVGQSKVDNTEAVRELSSGEFGVVIMSASTGAESSLEHPDWGHGAFTLSIIEGLEQQKADVKKDGKIYLRELDFYLAERVRELTGGRQHPTTQKPSSISVLPLISY
ncbi:caspase family protein [Reichenbachiella sp. MALMAid0571]|uniref:caspase family protein n=1 Tax=Reichenbachiella sp. MALMAid0571 TaxID=3143939 RepID=UPI0032DE5F39